MVEKGHRELRVLLTKFLLWAELKTPAKHNWKTTALAHHKEICSLCDTKQVQLVFTMLWDMVMMDRPRLMPAR